MNTLRFAVLIGALGTAILSSSSSFAQSVTDQDKVAQDKVQLAQYASRVNVACGGTHLQFSIDYASYQGKTAPGVRIQSPTEYLMNAGDAIIDICKTPAGKSAVAQKIHEVHGAYAPAEQESLSGGVFTYKIGFSGGNVDNPEKWLKAHL